MREPRPLRRPRRLRTLPRLGLVAAVLAIVVLPALGASPVVAARPDLTIVGQTTYEVLPDEGRIAVTVRLHATNHLRDTVTRRFFFRTGLLTVLPGSSSFRISGGAGKPKVSVAQRRATYTNLRIDLGANLAAGRSTNLTLQFDLKDPGGAPERPVRVTPSIVGFTAWAFATPDTPGATVEVRVPEGYDVGIGRGPLNGPSTGENGEQVFSSKSLDEPLTFVADVTADRVGAPVDTARDVPVGNGAAPVIIRSWADDTAWRDRVLGLLTRALPLLEEEIGVPWPVEGALVVEESLTRATDPYAGLFDPTERRIEVSYAASDVTVLHELAHAWFNGGLVADRWAAEAFASYYADRVAVRLGIPSTPLEQVDPTSAVAIPLNAWGEGLEPETEAYAYAAALELARGVASLAGDDHLRAAWARAAAGTPAYPADPEAAATEPAATDAESGAPPPDWRGLLDLLAEDSDQPLDDIWRTWVARPEDMAALDARAAAREAYASTVAAAGDWRLPPEIRDAMRAWRFDLAQRMLADARAALTERDALEASAAAAGLTLPARLREAFEGEDGLAAAADEAAAERAAVDAIVAAEGARSQPAGPLDGVLVQIGLIATDPESRLGIARTTLTAGDAETAYVAAVAARDAWADAAENGKSRLISAALLAGALVLLFGLVRQRRRSPSADATATDAPGERPTSTTES